MNTTVTFFMNFLFNFAVAAIIVRGIYYPVTRNKASVFTFLAFNTVIYFVLSFMLNIQLGIGVGFGLFAIFSILRYRTETMSIREMTYLFIISALAVMNSAGLNSDWQTELLLANLVILGVLFVLEKEWGFRYESAKTIVYEKIELIHPQRYEELKADLEARTGWKIKRVHFGKIDFLHDVVNLKVIYENDKEQNHWLPFASEE